MDSAQVSDLEKGSADLRSDKHILPSKKGTFGSALNDYNKVKPIGVKFWLPYWDLQMPLGHFKQF